MADKVKLEISIEFEPRDIWLGIYWDYREIYKMFHIYICIIPMLPIHITLDFPGDSDG